MISEVDIRDWEKVDVNEARRSLIRLDNEISDVGGVYQAYSMETLGNFINQVELIQRKQVKQVAALFKKSLIDE